MNYSEQLQIYGLILPKCKCCGGEIFWDNTCVKIGRSGDLKISGRSAQTTKMVNGTTYHLQVCQDCFERQYGKSKVNFGTVCEYTKWAFDISDSDYLEARKKYAMTKERMIEKYGESEGLRRWEQYCNTQAITNTFEYKHSKYGWTQEQFDEYNKSRSITKTNLIRRYGESEGLRRWEQYCTRQRITKSWDYMVQQFGEEQARAINRNKAITLENMIRVHGEIDGPKRYHKWLRQFEIREPQRWSKTSQKIFDIMRPIVEQYGYTCRYQTYGGEYSCVTGTGGYLLDFYIPELKVAVEYNGGVFHAEPRIYADSDHCDPLRPNLTAAEIRQRDIVRNQSLLNDLGIRVHIIWELDYEQGMDIEEFIRSILNNKDQHGIF